MLYDNPKFNDPQRKSMKAWFSEKDYLEKLQILLDAGFGISDFKNDESIVKAIRNTYPNGINTNQYCINHPDVSSEILHFALALFATN